MNDYQKIMLEAQLINIEQELNKNFEKEIKETAIKFLSNISITKENIDNYFEDAIIKAYKFEKYWRSKKWEKLLEEEKNSEK